MACRRKEKICSNLCQKDIVAESSEYPSHSSTNIAQNSSELSDSIDMSKITPNLDIDSQSRIKKHMQEFWFQRYCNGVMGAPITFLDNFSPNQFEILGLTTGRKDFNEISYPTKHYENVLQHNKDGSVVNGSKANTRATLLVDDVTSTYYTADNSDGKLVIVYARILIRKKAGA